MSRVEQDQNGKVLAFATSVDNEATKLHATIGLRFQHDPDAIFFCLGIFIHDPPVGCPKHHCSVADCPYHIGNVRG